MKTTKEMIEVMQAYVDGKEIQYLEKASNAWVTASYPKWDWGQLDYRIKPREPRRLWITDEFAVYTKNPTAIKTAVFIEVLP